MIDNHLHHKKSADGLDPRTVVWKRVMDMNDRSLRQIVVGLGGKQNGLPREDGFHITPASEIMAILCMAEDFIDLKKRLANIYIGQTYAGDPVFAKDLKAVGAMAVLLKDAIQPNLVQTLEGNPAIIHGGPFASIAQGTNTVIATKMGLSLADWVITEAGFAADLGAEKFFDIKCKSAGLQPVASVLVVTIRALRHHGGALKKELTTPSIDKVKLGMSNVEKHIENIQKFGIQPLVAINMFPGDTEEETQLVIDMCKELGVQAIPCTAFAEGGKGAEALAAALVQQVEHRPGNFQPLYNWNLSIEEKIHCVATEIYGAKEVAYSVKALSQLAQIKELGFSNLPVCIAKTPKSLSDDDRKRGRPEGFTITVREFELSSGAGFVIPVLGEMMRMPGLPQVPAAEQIDIDEAGTISGMF
jgi:formate--tetrahydrofolate ligase